MIFQIGNLSKLSKILGKPISLLKRIQNFDIKADNPITFFTFLRTYYPKYLKVYKSRNLFQTKLVKNLVLDNYKKSKEKYITEN